MSGHGHVKPNADGSKARCGGPRICKVCSAEKAAAIVAEYGKPLVQAEDGRYIPERDAALNDVQTGRKGEWMHTASGGRFYPEDPRPEEIRIGDIANGLALDCRYGGQCRIDSYYSVAEHSVHMAQYAWSHGWSSHEVLAVLLHDAAEAYLNDLPRAVKHAVGAGYERIEQLVSTCILRKYDVLFESLANAVKIKELDVRIVPLEKARIMNKPQPWAFDKFPPLEGVEIQCWPPTQARSKFMAMYVRCASASGLPIEGHDDE